MLAHSPMAALQAVVKIQVSKEEIAGAISSIYRSTNIARSMEDMRIVASEVKELTPEQFALIQINGNMAVAGTNKPASDVVPEKISTESISTTSSEEIVATAEGFITLWDKLIQQAGDLLDNNSFISEECKELTHRFNAIALQEEEFMVDVRIPKMLIKAYSGNNKDDFINYLGTAVGALTEHLRSSSVNTLNNVGAIVNNTLKSFGGSSIGVAKEELNGSTNTLNSISGGLVTTVVVPSTYEAVIDSNDKLTLVNTATVDGLGMEFKLDEVSLGKLSALITDTTALVGMSNVAINTFLAKNSSLGVDFFKESIKNLLGSSSVINKLILDYCDLFAKVSTSVNEELSTIAFISRFAIAVNELLENISKDIQLKSIKKAVDA